MKIDINPRGNGACPLCVHYNNCRYWNAIEASLEPFPADDASRMEIVVYSCPGFKEKD